MFDPTCCWSVCFTGCGFLSFYHIGAISCLSESAPHLLRDGMIFGSSAGALHGVILLSGLPLVYSVELLVDLARKARRRTLGPFHPSFLFCESVRDALQERLPDNAHQLISGKMGISLTRVSDGKNVLVSEFQSKEEVVDAVLCSCFVPFFAGIIPPSFRGERYIDGAFSNNAPFLDAKGTIVLSPFCGEFDICPKVPSTDFLHIHMGNMTYCICKRNTQLLLQTFLPPDPEVMAELCFQGYTDTYRFLEENGFCTSPTRALNLSSEQMEPEVVSPSGENQSEKEAEPLGPLRLSRENWDPQVLETVSPKLTAALSEAMRDSTGLGRSHDLLLVRILSYALLLCTLPVELAIATVHRLVRWLPDFPEDILLLHWVISKLCGHVMTCLLPSSRSQTPVNHQLTSANKPEHGPSGS